MTDARILIVEDEGITAKDLQIKLRQLGYTVPAIAFSGATALQHAATTSFDLALMDIRLQGEIDGIETAQRLRQQFQIPVVYLTAYADEETLQRAKATAPLGYLVKPFAPSELHSTIEMALSKHEMEQVLRDSHEELERRVCARTAELAATNEALRAEIAERKQAESHLRHSQEELRQLAARLQAVREEERIRIARELHDELGQALTGLKIDLASLTRKLPPTAQPLTEQVREMMKLADTTILTMRRLCTELRPGILDDLGIVAALEWQAQEFAERTGLRCHFSANVEDLPLDAERATAVFRICQETLTNVARHAQAHAVTIRLEQHPDALGLTVRDDGRGITASESSGTKSFGLLGMRERALVLGGTMTIEGTPGRGTAVTVHIPLPRPDSGLLNEL